MMRIFGRVPYPPNPIARPYWRAFVFAVLWGSTHPARFAWFFVDHCPWTMAMTQAWAAAPDRVKALAG